MSELGQLKASILEQVTREGERLLSKAKVQHEETFASQKVLVEKEFEAKKTHELEKLKRAFQIEEQKLLNKERSALLEAKQSVLTTLFDEALVKMQQLDERSEVAFIKSVLRQYNGQLITVTFGSMTKAKLSNASLEAIYNEIGNLYFSEESIKDQAGFIVSLGNADDNYLYETLMKAEQASQNFVIAQQIFNQ